MQLDYMQRLHETYGGFADTRGQAWRANRQITRLTEPVAQGLSRRANQTLNSNMVMLTCLPHRFTEQFKRCAGKSPHVSLAVVAASFKQAGERDRAVNCYDTYSGRVPIAGACRASGANLGNAPGSAQFLSNGNGARGNVLLAHWRQISHLVIGNTEQLPPGLKAIDHATSFKKPGGSRRGQQCS